MSDLAPNPATSPGSSMERRRTRRWATRLIVVLVVSLLTVGALAIAIPWVSYRFDHVVLSEAAVKGTVTKIGGRIEGRIKSIEVEPGQRIAKGEVLLRLEDRHLQAALDRARAEEQSATKELQSEKMGIEQTRRRLTWEIDRLNGMRKKAVGELDAQKSSLEKLQKGYERIVTLLKTGAAASIEMDRITGDRDRAQGLVGAATGGT